MILLITFVVPKPVLTGTNRISRYKLKPSEPNRNNLPSSSNNDPKKFKVVKMVGDSGSTIVEMTLEEIDKEVERVQQQLKSERNK